MYVDVYCFQLIAHTYLYHLSSSSSSSCFLALCLSPLLGCSFCDASAASAASIRNERNHRWLSGLHCAFHSRAACQLTNKPISRPGGGCSATFSRAARTLGRRAAGAVCGRQWERCDEMRRRDSPPRCVCIPISPGSTTTLRQTASDPGMDLGQRPGRSVMPVHQQRAVSAAPEFVHTL